MSTLIKTPTWTRGTYIRVAKLLAKRSPDPMTATITEDFITMFKADNPRFNEVDFLEAIVQDGGLL